MSSPSASELLQRLKQVEGQANAAEAKVGVAEAKADAARTKVQTIEDGLEATVKSTVEEKFKKYWQIAKFVGPIAMALVAVGGLIGWDHFIEYVHTKIVERALASPAFVEKVGSSAAVQKAIDAQLKDREYVLFPLTGIKPLALPDANERSREYSVGVGGDLPGVPANARGVIIKAGVLANVGAASGIACGPARESEVEDPRISVAGSTVRLRVEDLNGVSAEVHPASPAFVFVSGLFNCALYPRNAVGGQGSAQHAFRLLFVKARKDADPLGGLSAVSRVELQGWRVSIVGYYR